MSLEVSIATSSAFIALVVRRALAKLRHLEVVGDHRDADAAAGALGRVGLAIVDVELLRDAAGLALRKTIASRRRPTILIDARAEGTPQDLAGSTALLVVRGQRKGELDLEAIEAGLGPAVAQARRLSSGAVARERDEPQADPVEPYEGPLELIVVGVSTGGPTLLLELFPALTTPTVPFLTVQHMPESETKGFAARLSEESGHAVVEIGVGPLPATGTIGVVRGGHDVRVVRRGEGSLVLREATLGDNPFHPNVDEVLQSAVAADVAVGAVILTGMGNDGAAGARALARRGLPVIAQRPDTCTVAGMPQAVIDAGAARSIQSPDVIARTLNRWFAEAASARAKGAPS